MPEEIQDVNSTESSPEQEQEVVNQEAPATDQQEQPQEAATPPPAPEGNLDVDDKGVPWKNRAYEWQRKAEELTERLPSMVEEKLKMVLQNQQPAERKYTVDELEAFASQTDNPYHAQWARSEIRKLEKTEQAKVIRDEINRWKGEQQANARRQSAFQYVVNTYPDAFTKNSSGQVTGWNNNHPLTQQIGSIMRDPRFANDPEGLVAASDIAWARYTRNQQPIVQRKQQELREEVKNLQKKTLVEGGTRSSSQPPKPHQAALEKAKQTGTIKDATAALDAIMKAYQTTE